MSSKSPRVWVHVFEEDTPEGAVFRPDDANIPLSRRPRERFELRPDGTAVLLSAGPDDRPVPKPARWSEEENGIVLRAGGAVRLKILEQSEDRLLVDLAGWKQR